MYAVYFYDPDVLSVRESCPLFRVIAFRLYQLRVTISHVLSQYTRNVQNL